MMPNELQTSTDLNPFQRTLPRLASVFSVVVVVIGLFVLLGWQFDIELFKRVIPTFVAMNPTTAMTFVYASASLVLLQLSHARLLRTWGKILAWLVIAIGLVRLTGYLTGWEVGIDQLLFRDKLNAEDPLLPNRMAPNTALGFVLLGAALAFADVRTRRSIFPAEFFALLVLILSLLAITGYAFGVRPFIGYAQFIPMALHTAVCFFLLSLGLFFTFPNRGLMNTITSPYAGGMIARKLLPLAILLPIVLGWLRLLGERAGWYQTDFGTAFFATLMILVFSIGIWWNATSLNNADAAHRRTQEELHRISLDLEHQKAETRFRTTLDHLLEGCQIIGYDWRYLYLNDVAAQQGHYPKEQLLGRTMMEMYPGIETTPMFTLLRRCMEEREPQRMENRFQFPNGTEGWFHLSMEPVPEGVFILSADITKEKQLQKELQHYREHLEALVKKRTEQLEAANKELEAFSYSVSHDLRAPLRHIDGFADLLLKKTAAQLDEKAKQYLTTIVNSARQMGQLIDDLLVFSRMGRAELRANPVDMGVMVREVIQSFAHETKGRDIRWIVHPLPMATADASMIRLVWQNLLGNAIKYTRPRQEAVIEIGGLEEGSVQTFFVRDNGVGFDMKYSHKLFGVFQRLHRTEEFEGTGIGLANVQRIVARHGGTTRAEGALGEGATVYFTLPLQQGTGAKNVEETS